MAIGDVASDHRLADLRRTATNNNALQKLTFVALSAACSSAADPLPAAVSLLPPCSEAVPDCFACAALCSPLLALPALLKPPAWPAATASAMPATLLLAARPLALLPLIFAAAAEGNAGSSGSGPAPYAELLSNIAMPSVMSAAPSLMPLPAPAFADGSYKRIIGRHQRRDADMHAWKRNAQALAADLQRSRLGVRHHVRRRSAQQIAHVLRLPNGAPHQAAIADDSLCGGLLRRWA